MQTQTTQNAMKKNLRLVLICALAVLCLVGCKKEKITVTPNELWFPATASVQELQLTANCSWTISIDDGANWYTIKNISDTAHVVSGMSGKGDARLSVSVNPLEEGQRTSTFTITSAKGNAIVKVSVSQNTETPTELTSLTNLVFGVSNVAHWNTDYFGNIIEDSYKHKEFDPYDTTRGYMMFFMENGLGVQRDHSKDSVVYYSFSYNYDALNRILHIEFETETGEAEIYDAPVLSATFEVFRFQHEYRPHFWERADMKKVGSIITRDKALLQKQAKKRKSGEPIFQF